MQRFPKNSLSSRSLILELIRSNDDIFKAEIARMTGLSIPTVMRITDTFLEEGYVKVTGKGVSKGGKPPETLRIIPESRYFAGVDMSDSIITCALLDLKGRVMIKDSVSLNEDDLENEGVAERAIEILERILHVSNTDKEKLYGIGVGVPGVCSPETGLVTSQSIGLTSFDMINAFKSRFNLPVFIDNTAKATALAEQWYGAGASGENFIMVALGRGIGSAMVVDGEIFRGSHNMSGELGHTVVEVNGALCRCGKRGCLETVASSRVIARQARQLLRDGFESEMAELAGGEIDNVNILHVMAAAEKGDKIALMLAENMIAYLSVSIENMVDLFDIRNIIMSGRVIRKSDWFFNNLQERLKKSHTRYRAKDTIKLAAAQLGNDAAAVGAATLPLIDFVYSMDR